jgi:hypothetical protein
MLASAHGCAVLSMANLETEITDTRKRVTDNTA